MDNYIIWSVIDLRKPAKHYSYYFVSPTADLQHWANEVCSQIKGTKVNSNVLKFSLWLCFVNSFPDPCGSLDT